MYTRVAAECHPTPRPQQLAVASKYGCVYVTTSLGVVQAATQCRVSMYSAPPPHVQACLRLSQRISTTAPRSGRLNLPPSPLRLRRFTTALVSALYPRKEDTRCAAGAVGYSDQVLQHCFSKSSRHVS